MTTTTRRSSAPRRRPARALCAAACLLFAAPALMAQDGSQRPPRVEGVEEAKTLIHYVVGIGIIALCVGVAVIPGRRDHDE